MLPAASASSSTPLLPLLVQDDEVAGRRRRARGVDDEDDGEAGEAVLPWPSPFGKAAGSDAEGEDEELLRRAKQGRLLADSQALDFELEGEGSGFGGSGGSGSIPLDEGSQEVLGLLARSLASEPQMGSAGSGPLLRSRFAPAGGGAGPAPAITGSDPLNNRLPASSAGGGAGAPALSRGPSFVGRQHTVQRMASSNGMGGGSRSYVFGREDSNTAAPADKVRERKVHKFTSLPDALVLMLLPLAP